MFARGRRSSRLSPHSRAVANVLNVGGLATSAAVAPTLLIVDGRDRQALELNRLAASQLRNPHDLAVVDGARHLFEEPGALKHVAELALEWLRRHFIPKREQTLSGVG